MRYPQVKCRPVVAVAVAIAVFAVLGYHRRRQLPVFPQRQDPVRRKAQGGRVLGQVAIAPRLTRFGAQPDAVLQGAFRHPRRQAVELLFVVQGQHRVVAVFGGVIAAQGIAPGGRGIIFQVIVALGGHHRGHQLPVAVKMVGGEQQILDVIIRVIIAAKVAEVTRIHRIIAAQAASPVDIIDPAAGATEEHDVAIGKVDIEVIPIEAFAGPDRGAF